MLRDAWLLATGTLTAVRVPPPVPRRPPGRRPGDGARAARRAPPRPSPRRCVVLVGDWIDLPPLATAYVVVLALALGTRAFHWDGLADTADGLTASYSPERSLEVMRTGPVGPAGVVAVVLVAGLQAAGARVGRPARARPGRSVGAPRSAPRAPAWPWPACAASRPPAPTASAPPIIGAVPVVGCARHPGPGGRRSSRSPARPRLGLAAADRPGRDGGGRGRPGPPVRTPPRRDHRRRPGRGGRGLVRGAGAGCRDSLTIARREGQLACRSAYLRRWNLRSPLGRRSVR